MSSQATVFVRKVVRAVQADAHIVVDSLSPSHVHSDDCGHQKIQHGDHFDYLVGRFLHHEHDGHFDVCGEVETDLIDPELQALRNVVEATVVDGQTPLQENCAVPDWVDKHRHQRTEENALLDSHEHGGIASGLTDGHQPHLRRRNARFMQAAAEALASADVDWTGPDLAAAGGDAETAEPTPHGHSHSHKQLKPKKQPLKWYRDRDALRFVSMMCLTGTFMIVELAVGVIIGSLALQADAFHMASDLLALLVGFYAARMSKQRPNSITDSTHEIVLDSNNGGGRSKRQKAGISGAIAAYSYGYVRMEVVGSLINGVFLLAVCLQIFIEALQRLVSYASNSASAESIQETGLMMWVGCGGLAINILGLWIFSHGAGGGGGHGHSHGGHGHSHGGGHGHSHGGSGGNLNIRGVFLHVLGDALGSVAVIISGIIMRYTEWAHRELSDPLSSLIIVLIICVGTMPIVRQAVSILLQRVPEHVNIGQLKADVLRIEGVLSIHDLHVWGLTETTTVASLHVLLDRRTSSWRAVVDSIKMLLHKKGIHASTVQPEFVSIAVQRQLEAAAAAVASAAAAAVVAVAVGGEADGHLHGDGGTGSSTGLELPVISTINVVPTITAAASLPPSTSTTTAPTSTSAPGIVGWLRRHSSSRHQHQHGHGHDHGHGHSHGNGDGHHSGDGSCGGGTGSAVAGVTRASSPLNDHGHSHGGHGADLHHQHQHQHQHATASRASSPVPFTSASPTPAQMHAALTTAASILLSLDVCNEPVCSAVCMKQTCCPGDDLEHGHDEHGQAHAPAAAAQSPQVPVTTNAAGAAGQQPV